MTTSMTLSVVEAAQNLGVSPYTLRSWIRARRESSHRLGRRIALGAEGVKKFLFQHRAEPRHLP